MSETSHVVQPRIAWVGLSDAVLLSQCDVDTYRASGPGGQKKNKTSSAVRLRHAPSGLIVIAEESRSQHANKAKALVRLRQAFYLHWRNECRAGAKPTVGDGDRIDLRIKDPRFWPAVGIVLDVLAVCEGRVSVAAERLGTSTANLVDFLQTDSKVWQEANRIRTGFGLKGLKIGD